MKYEEQYNEFIDELTPFGFTRQEALIYITLLENPGITGYEIGKTIGKSATNIYKILLTLESKNAVFADLGTQPRSYIAVPPSELMSLHEQNMRKKRKSLENKFCKLGKNVSNISGIYPLTNSTRIWNKASEMIKQAETVIIINRKGEFPQDIAALLNEKSASGVDIIVKTYNHIAIPGAHIELVADKVKWNPPENVEWLDVIVDGSQVLISFQNEINKAPYAFWSNNKVLSINIYNGHICEFYMTRLAEKADMDEETGFFKDLNYLNHLRTSNLSAFKDFISEFTERDE